MKRAETHVTAANIRRLHLISDVFKCRVSSIMSGLVVPRKTAEIANRIEVGTLNPDRITVDAEGWREERENGLQEGRSHDAVRPLFGYSTTWTIAYAVSNTPASFSPLGTYSDPGSIGITNRSFRLGTDANNQANNLWIRITALSASTGSGSRDTIGIDNFSLSWTTNNLAVVMPAITAIVINGRNVQIDFTGRTDALPPSFLLLSSAQIGDAYADTGAVITSPGSGLFRTACAVNGPQQFYRTEQP